jgi:hypothetical protein
LQEAGEGAGVERRAGKLVLVEKNCLERDVEGDKVRSA